MFAIKLIFGVILIFLSSKIAVIKAKNHKEKYLYYLSAKLMCKNLEGELLYLRRPINQALDIDYPSFYYAKTVNSVILGEKTIFYPDFLTVDEISKFELLFEQLGKTDSNSQMAYVLSCKEDFVKIENEKRLEYQKFYSLTLKIGFLIGVALFVLVI